MAHPQAFTFKQRFSVAEMLASDRRESRMKRCQPLRMHSSLALDKHHGQVDKGGAPYIIHPLRVMCAMQTETEQIVAVLHDVVEDTDVTLDDLRRMGYSEEIVEAVDHLSRRDGESYEAFIQRIKPHPLAVRVKLARFARQHGRAPRRDAGRKSAGTVPALSKSVA